MMAQPARVISIDEFNQAAAAVWTEIEYQNSLPQRTADREAQDVPGFCALIQRYLRKVEDAWADDPCIGSVKAAEEGLRKLSAIALRGMVYTRIWKRGE